MGCGFCATKPHSFVRDLTPGEMLGQVTAIAKTGSRVGNIVVMGVGEPFDNYDNTLKFIRLLHEHEETNIGFRKVTISTCGILPGILRLAGEGLPIGLSVSLHSPADSIRSMLMPVNKRYSIDKLLEGCKIYTYKTNRRITFEYALIKDVNDAPDDARELLRKIRGMLCHINIIPINKTENSDYAPPSGERIKRFLDIIVKGGLKVTVRRELGSDIMAACGQLRNSSQ
jgi:23S rRNA (adenine2503-C2)-methyltransferase